MWLWDVEETIFSRYRLIGGGRIAALCAGHGQWTQSKEAAVGLNFSFRTVSKLTATVQIFVFWKVTKFSAQRDTSTEPEEGSLVAYSSQALLSTHNNLQCHDPARCTVQRVTESIWEDRTLVCNWVGKDRHVSATWSSLLVTTSTKPGLCKIWGFHGGDYEEWCLLGCYTRCVRRLLVTASVVPSSPILVTLMKEALSSSDTSVLTGATRWTSQNTPFFTPGLQFLDFLHPHSLNAQTYYYESNSQACSPHKLRFRCRKRQG
jgi:hypothetical protein